MENKNLDRDLALALECARGQVNGVERDKAMYALALIIVAVDPSAARSMVREIERLRTRASTLLCISMFTENGEDVDEAFKVMRNIGISDKEEADLRLLIEVQWACTSQDWPKARAACAQINDEHVQYRAWCHIADDSGIESDRHYSEAMEPDEDDEDSDDEDWLMRDSPLLIADILDHWNWWTEKAVKAACKERQELLEEWFRLGVARRVLLGRLIALAVGGAPAIAETLVEKNRFALDAAEKEQFLCSMAAGFALIGLEREARNLLRQVPTTTTYNRHLVHAYLYALKCRRRR